MSEELTKLIDKTIGKKGRLRVPAYWMHKVLSGIVGYVNRQVKKLEKALASTSEKLKAETAARVEAIKELSPEVVIHEGEIGNTIIPTPFKSDLYLDLLRSASWQYTEDGKGQEYKIYAFMNAKSSFLGLAVKEFGLYEINMLRQLELPPHVDIKLKKLYSIPAMAYATFVTTSDTESISLSGIRTRYYKGKVVGTSSHTPGRAGEHSYIVFYDEYGDSATFKDKKQLTKIELAAHGSHLYISSSKFYGCTNLQSVIIPEGVGEISVNAFYGCSSLKSIDIPNSVRRIYASAFGSSGLTEIVVPDSVHTIGDEAFSNCYFLKSVKLPTHVTVLPYGIFRSCTSLNNIVIPNSVTSIGNSAFRSCTSLNNIVIPNSVTSIGDYAFCDCDLFDNIVIPNSVTSIGNSAFQSCTGLTSITIPESVTSIGGSAFSSTSLKAIVLPNLVTNIGGAMFRYCTNLETVIFGESIVNIGDYAFDHCSSLVELIIPDSVVSISRQAFNGCSSLTTVIFGKSINTLGNALFQYCNALEKLDFSSAEAVPTADNIFMAVTGFKVIVPDALYDEWITAAYWSEYADHIVKASEYVETE